MLQLPYRLISTIQQTLALVAFEQPKYQKINPLSQ